MISAIIGLVSSLLGFVFSLVSGILYFALSLPLWLIIIQNLFGLLILTGVISKVFSRNRRG